MNKSEISIDSNPTAENNTTDNNMLNTPSKNDNHKIKSKSVKMKQLIINKQIKPIILSNKNKNSKMKTLIIDLDETLIHSSYQQGENRSDLVFNVIVN